MERYSKTSRGVTLHLRERGGEVIPTGTLKGTVCLTSS